MQWNIEARGEVLVVTMRSNPVNKMNPEFFDDMSAALDAVERDHPRLSLVLTAPGNTFSAGLDFEDVFPRFARGDDAEIESWFLRFRDLILRLFKLGRRTVAAINGNAFAGGLILATACDHRIGTRERGKFAINEAQIGIPMPGVFTEIVRYAIGTRAASEAILGGQVYDVEQARALGFLHAVVPGEQLVAAAVEAARLPLLDSASAYAASKATLQHPALSFIDGPAVERDREALRVIRLADSLAAQRATLARLKVKS